MRTEILELYEFLCLSRLRASQLGLEDMSDIIFDELDHIWYKVMTDEERKETLKKENLAGDRWRIDNE